MKSGIKYVDGMDLRGVIKAGLENFELDYTGCKSADMILENGGNIDGIAISLCDFTDKGFLKENASQIFKDAMSVADRYNAYIVIDKEIALEWARIPHFYTPFYVYQYATGYSAAIAISRKILSGDEKAKEGYFKFLSGGSSMNPIDLLRLCDVDMATKEPVESALKLFGELLDEMEEILKTQ